MAHDITVRNDGRAEAAFSLTPAWHGLGTTFDHVMDSREALLAAGLDWDVVQRQMAYEVPGQMVDTPDGPVQRIEYRDAPILANTRGDNGFFLGAVSEHYRVVQNREAFGFLDSLVSDGAIQIESAFSLGGGKRVVVCGRMPNFDQIGPGDDLARYLIIALHHDGTGCVNFGPTSVRVVCANTYAMAREQGHIKGLSIRHTGRIQDKLEEARRIILRCEEQFGQFADQGRALAAATLNDGEFARYLDILCPLPLEQSADWSARRVKELTKTRRDITERFHRATNRVGSMAGTWWAAFNAVTEQVDHLPRRGRDTTAKAEARFNVALYGTGANHKRRAFVTACRFAGLQVAG